jgi:CRP-like cAMP-binding protein
MQTDGIDPFQFLRSLSFFSKVSVRDLESLAYSCQVGQIAAGEYLFMEGEEEPYSSFVVISGRVAMLKSSMSGKELIVQLLETADVFSLLLLLEGEGQAVQLSAKAMSATTVLWVPVAQFRSVLHGHPGLFRELMANLLSTLQTSYRLCLGLAHDHVDVRIATALSTLAQKIGRSDGSSSNEISQGYTVNLTRQQLADLTGTTSETAIRVTRAMHKQGLLDIRRPGVIRIPSLKLLEEVAQGWT